MHKLIVSGKLAMNNFIYKILVLSLFTSCQADEKNQILIESFKIQGDSVLNLSNCSKLIDLNDLKIYDFDNQLREPTEPIKKYELENEGLIKSKKFKNTYELTDNNFKSYFKQIERFNLGKSKNELSNFLISNNFTYEDSIIKNTIEFQFFSNHRYIEVKNTDTLGLLTANHNWELQNVLGELFFIFDITLFWPPFQVIGFNEQELKLKAYGKNDYYIKLTKSHTTYLNNSDLLIGNWDLIELVDSCNYILPPSPPGKKRLKEKLEFKQDTLIKSVGKSQNIELWKIDRSGQIIYNPEKWPTNSDDYIKIIELNEESLIIEKYRRLDKNVKLRYKKSTANSGYESWQGN
ncbi:hypothetical protein [Marinifilum sp.]|uniref:hypothetical protein n=1 Tax=Marinifilum sp. TaxID=2033137 RepID=UPI003BAD176B